MATNKTLTPTNVTIQIPEFTDKPDQRVNSNCIDKEADAINALSDQTAHLASTSSFNNVDLNSYTTNGFYFFGTGCSNAPNSNVGVMIFSTASNIVFQVAINLAGDTYTRVKVDNWTTWKKLND